MDRRPLALALLCLAAPLAHAQSKPVRQPAKPPVAQAWVDVATFSGLGVPVALSGGVMEGLSGLFGGKKGGDNRFGMTQGFSSGRWLDVTVLSRANPGLAEATQRVPEGSRLAPELKLVAVQPEKPKPVPESDDEVVEPEPMERPKGKILMYWGCSDTVRPGQPRVLDLANAAPADYMKLMQARRATQRGAHQAPGRPSWPNPGDARRVPEGASLVGEHAFAGSGIPEGFRFNLPPAQDFMPALDLAQQGGGASATALSWSSLNQARGYFLMAMGARGEQEMVFWTSSEVPETGWGLMDYQTDAAVSRWVKEKVLLPGSATRCSIPAGVFGESGGAMLRMIAYGDELNLAYPPRPANPKQVWEPQWAVKVRVKSVHAAMLGMPGGREAPREEPAPQQPGIKDLLRGILGG